MHFLKLKQQLVLDGYKFYPVYVQDMSTVYWAE